MQVASLSSNSSLGAIVKASAAVCVAVITSLLMSCQPGDEEAVTAKLSILEWSGFEKQLKTEHFLEQ